HEARRQPVPRRRRGLDPDRRAGDRASALVPARLLVGGDDGRRDRRLPPPDGGLGPGRAEPPLRRRERAGRAGLHGSGDRRPLPDRARARPPVPVKAAGLIAVVALLVAWGARIASTGAARTALRDGDVLARVTPAKDPRARELAALARRPGDLSAALRVARLHLEEARRTGDPRHLGRAEAALLPWGDDLPAEGLVLRATLRQARHAFTGALADLARVPGDDRQAALERATVLAVVGRMAEARAACDRLGDATLLVGCRAPIDALTGRAREARAALEAALER